MTWDRLESYAFPDTYLSPLELEISSFDRVVYRRFNITRCVIVVVFFPGAPSRLSAS